MIHIDKNLEPRNLTHFRESTPAASYSGLPTNIKDEIRGYLLKEQGYVCAYCMRRIKLETTSIEHYAPQSINDTNDLNYENMLGVCFGNEGDPYKRQTCGSHRGNSQLTVNPLVKGSVGKIEYSRDGHIKSKDATIDHDLNETLNLNVSLLVSNRKSVLLALIGKLSMCKGSGTWRDLAWKYINKINKDEVKQEYCGILLWYLYMKAK